jgi:hypothetical protein
VHISVSQAISVALYAYVGILHWDLLRAHDRLLGHFDDIERAETEEIADLGERVAFLLVKASFPHRLAAATESTALSSE